MREGWRRTGEKEGDVISPGMSLNSLQVWRETWRGTLRFQRRADGMLLSTALRIKSQYVVSVLEQSLERMFLSRPNGSRVYLPGGSLLVSFSGARQDPGIKEEHLLPEKYSISSRRCWILFSSPGVLR